MRYAYVAEGFLSHNTATSRLSSNDPNAQNFPRKTEDPRELLYDYGPKKLFTSRFGEEGTIIQLDYCLAGDTMVEIAGGGSMPIKEIVERVNKGEDIYVYSCNPETFETVVSKVERGMLTQRNAPTVRVNLDNGESVIATGEHKFMMRSGSYKEAKDLKPGESLMPFREYIGKEKDVTYRHIGVGYREKEREHRIVAKYFHGEPEEEDMIVHHKDGNGMNNHPDNLQYMTQNDHFSLHLHDYWGAMTPEERSAKARERFDDELREKQRELAIKQWANYTPEKRAEISRKISESVDFAGEKNPMFGKSHGEETRAKLSERQKAAQAKVSDEVKLERSRMMRRAQVDKIAKAILADGEKITSKNWKKYKNRNTPRWENAIGDLVFGGFMTNHKVVSVEPVGRMDVYCIKAENFSNFALSSGIFVSNSQLELRIASIFSQDENLQYAYKNGKDLHIYVASKVYKKPEEEVTKDERSAAKAVGFGLIYGKSAPSLAEDLGISREEAQEFIDSYFKEFPGIKIWMDSMRKQVKRDKYVETLSGFRRHLKGIDSNERGIVADSERQAINSPVQGSGASMTLQSLIDIDKLLTEYKLKSKMIMTVHDSIVFDAHIDEVYSVVAIAKTVMENLSFDWITVPIVADVEIGRNYQDLVEVEFDELGDIIENGLFDYIDTELVKGKIKDYDRVGLPLPDDVKKEADRLNVDYDG